MKETVDALNMRMYGLKLSEIQEKKICIKCGKSVRGMLESDEDRVNYDITGLCWECMK